MDDFELEFQLSQLKFTLDRGAMRKRVIICVALNTVIPALSVLYNSKNLYKIVVFLLVTYLTLAALNGLWNVMVDVWSEYLEGPVEILVETTNKYNCFVPVKPVRLLFWLMDPKPSSLLIYHIFPFLSSFPSLIAPFIVETNVNFFLRGWLVYIMFATAFLLEPRLKPSADVDTLDHLYHDLLKQPKGTYRFKVFPGKISMEGKVKLAENV